MSVPREMVTWTTREPDRYRSSPIAARGFCRECGTPLTYEGDGEPDLDLTIGSFDDPARFRPIGSSGWEGHHPAWLDVSALPHKRTDQNQATVAAWQRVGGAVP